MKLHFLALIIIILGVAHGARRPRRCTTNQDCRDGQPCVKRCSRHGLWGWWSWRCRGVCELKRCQTASDCGSEECCMGKKKRQTSASGSDGVCKPLKSEGTRGCQVDFPSGKPSSIVSQCPCKAGLSCVARGGTGECQVPAPPTICRSDSDCEPDECCDQTAQVKGRKKRQVAGVCRSRQTTGGSVCSRPRPCETGADCGPAECCMSPNRPIGRKKRQTGGFCKPLGNTGSMCLRNDSPNSVKSVCPCESGLTCQGPFYVDIPLGEAGVCRTPRPCETGADCRPEECCMFQNWARGRKKRQTATGGFCEPLGNSGSMCLRNDSPNSVKPVCPCESGLTCQGPFVLDVPLGEAGVCNRPRPCETGADCGPEECCKSPNRPKGRKKRQTATGGFCESLGNSGSMCLRNDSPNSVKFVCPCESGLTCQGPFVLDAPLGEAGTCG